MDADSRPSRSIEGCHFHDGHTAPWPARQIQADLGSNPDMPVFQHAMIYAIIGDDGAAFEWLERAFIARTDMYTLRAHPGFSRMRAQPRFVRLLERLDLR